MNILNLLNPALIECNIEIASKKALLETLSTLFSTQRSPLIKDQLFDAFVAREKLGSTAMGHGVAIPHIRTPLFTTPQLSIIKLTAAIDFDAEDHRPVDLIFALIAPEESNQAHLSLLAECSALLISSEFRQAIRQASSTSEILTLIKSFAQQNQHARAI